MIRRTAAVVGVIASSLVMAGGVSGCASRNAEAASMEETAGTSLADRIERAEFAAMEAQRSAEEAKRIAQEAKATAERSSTDNAERTDRAFERSQYK